MNDGLRATADDVVELDDKYRRNWELRSNTFLFPIGVQLEDVIKALTADINQDFTYAKMPDKGQMLIYPGGLDLTIKPEHWIPTGDHRYEWKTP